MIFDNKLYVQKRGICIGSCVSPVLCNIFLSAVDRRLNSAFNSDKLLAVCRYVDDLVVLKKQEG